MRTKRPLLAVLVLLILASLGMYQKLAAKEWHLVPQAKPVRPELFSLNYIGSDRVIWPTVQFGSWRSSASLWKRVEPWEGEWHLEGIEHDVSMAEEHHVPILLELGIAAPWAQDSPVDHLEHWRQYVQTVATEFKGRVHEYQLWNEPDGRSMYRGTPAELVVLSREAYTILKKVDPSVTVIGPAHSGIYKDSIPYFEKYLELGGDKYQDVISFHFYVAPEAPEAMLPRIEEVKSIMAKHSISKPLWTTEIGWNIENPDRTAEHMSAPGKPLDYETASAYIARTYILSWAAGVERVYWYAWGHQTMGFTDFAGKNPKPITKAYEVTLEWLVGKQMQGCNSTAQGWWTCDISSSSGNVSHVVWNTSGTFSFAIPKKWKAKRMGFLDGSYRPLSSTSVSVGASPILFEN